MSDRTLTVDGETITLSHPNKVLFPEDGLPVPGGGTKARARYWAAAISSR